MFPNEIEISGIRGICVGLYTVHSDERGWGVAVELGPLAITFWWHPEAKS
jgi:hypothetical protein